MAAMGNIQPPTPGPLRKPPHLPKNITAFGLTALIKSITVAAFALPIPKLIIVIPSLVAACIALPTP